MKSSGPAAPPGVSPDPPSKFSLNGGMSFSGLLVCRSEVPGCAARSGAARVPLGAAGEVAGPAFFGAFFDAPDLAVFGDVGVTSVLFFGAAAGLPGRCCNAPFGRTGAIDRNAAVLRCAAADPTLGLARTLGFAFAGPAAAAAFAVMAGVAGAAIAGAAAKSGTDSSIAAATVTPLPIQEGLPAPRIQRQPWPSRRPGRRGPCQVSPN